MREIIIKNPIRIKDVYDEGVLYHHGLLVRAYTPDGDFIVEWEHSPGYGWFLVHRDGPDFGDANETFACRNHVLIASIESAREWPRGADIPVLSPDEADKFIRENGIPKDNWETFNRYTSRELR